MEQATVKTILEQLSTLRSPASFSTIEKEINDQRNRLREELREELRRSLNFQHVKLHPDLKKHGFKFTEHLKDTVASLMADILVQDGCSWNEHVLIKIEPAVFLSPSESLQDSAVVVLHFADGSKEHRTTSFHYK